VEKILLELLIDDYDVVLFDKQFYRIYEQVWADGMNGEINASKEANKVITSQYSIKDLQIKTVIKSHSQSTIKEHTTIYYFNESYRLIRAEFSYDSNLFSDQYNYDDHNNLIEKCRSKNGLMTDKYIFEYDNNCNLIKKAYYSDRSSGIGFCPYLEEENVFEYAENKITNGSVILSIFENDLGTKISINHGPSYTAEYIYNKNKHIVQRKHYDDGVLRLSSDEIHWLYDDRNNWIECKVVNTTGTITYFSKRILEYLE
jgi:hypothetical protein